MYNETLSSVNQTQAKHDVSEKYSFIPTTRVLDVLAKENWLPSSAKEVNARGDNRGFQKHLIRLRNSSLPTNNGLIPEVVLINSHNRASVFKLMSGIFRIVCENGLITGDSFADHSIRHIGYTDDAIKEAIAQIVDITPKIFSRVNEFKEIFLNNDEKIAFASAALDMKYDEGHWELNDKEKTINRLILPRRNEDSGNDLWKTYNVVQEKIMKSGFPMINAEGYRRKARATKSVGNDVRLNRALWALTEKMAELKAK